MQPVARVSTCYPDKFGAPRQSGLVPDARARLVFEPPFRHPDAVRGLEGFSHLWLVWVFSENVDKGWSPTVRPPRLGGNVRMGVFATRAPFRPNPIGLSAVRLERVELHPLDGPVLHLSGVDLVDGTPILDIKPYVPLADCIPEASEGFTAVPMNGWMWKFPNLLAVPCLRKRGVRWKIRCPWIPVPSIRMIRNGFTAFRSLAGR